MGAPDHARAASRSIIIFCCAALSASACATYEIKRSALVPAVTPPIITGHPLDNGRVRLSVGNATYLRAAKPRENPNRDTNAGLYIPRTQFAGQLLVRIGRLFALGAKMELGLNSGAEAIAPDVAPKPTGDVFGMGPVAQAWIPLTAGLELHLHGEALLFGAPFDEYTRRLDGPGGKPTPWSLARSETNFVWVFTLAGAMAYRVGPFAFFAGLSIRNQPTNVELQQSSSAGTVLAWTQDEVTAGPTYGIIFGGATFRFARRFEVTAQLYQPLTDNPVQYGGPAMAVWLSVALGDGPRVVRRRLAPSVKPPPSKPRPHRPVVHPAHQPEIVPPPAPPRPKAPAVPPPPPVDAPPPPAETPS